MSDHSCWQLPDGSKNALCNAQRGSVIAVNLEAFALIPHASSKNNCTHIAPCQVVASDWWQRSPWRPGSLGPIYWMPPSHVPAGLSLLKLQDCSPYVKEHMQLCTMLLFFKKNRGNFQSPTKLICTFNKLELWYGTCQLLLVGVVSTGNIPPTELMCFCNNRNMPPCTICKVGMAHRAYVLFQEKQNR